MAHIFLICDPGDLVLVPNPGYPILVTVFVLVLVWSYPYMKKRCVLDFQDIPEDIPKKQKSLLFRIQSGLCFCRCGFLRAVDTFAKQYDIIVIHDAAYADLAFGETLSFVLSFEEERSRSEFYFCPTTIIPGSIIFIR